MYLKWKITPKKVDILCQEKNLFFIAHKSCTAGYLVSTAFCLFLLRTYLRNFVLKNFRQCQICVRNVAKISFKLKF